MRRASFFKSVLVGLFVLSQGGLSSAQGFLPGVLPDLSGLVKKVTPAVVNISTKTDPRPHRRDPYHPQGPRDPFSDDFFERFFGRPVPQGPQRSLGSGFVINEDGYILTNNHVVSGADEVQVQLTDKRQFPAKIIGTDPKTDVAVLKIEAEHLPTVSMGNSANLKVGEWVLAVGNPFGLDSTVTAGIVSAKGRVIGAGPYDDFIQTDASINPGNSGGPLFNLKGEVVGINTAIVTSGQGIGFAIPINLAKGLVPQLIASGKVTRAWLGVGIQDMTPDLAKSFGLKDSQGALVANVFPGSPADQAGLKPGDIIRKFGGQKTEDSHDLPSLVASQPVGAEVKIELLRQGQEKTLEVKLGEMGEDSSGVKAEAPSEGVQLGMAVRALSEQEAKDLGLGQPGVRVVFVEPSGPAAQVGVMTGDIILRVNGKPVESLKSYQKMVEKIPSGDIIQLLLRREDGQLYLAFPKP